MYDLSLQGLINSGTWGLEGSVGRAMMDAIDNGEAILGKEPARTYWGNRIPSRYEVQDGTPGSLSYANELRARNGLDELTEDEFDAGLAVEQPVDDEEPRRLNR